MDPNAAIFYEFGVFRLDPVQKILSAETEDIRLSPKAFDLLLFLARNPNQVIPKETLLSEVWRDSFVEEANLAVQISNLRKIFSAVPHNSVSIETFPKVGYRFAASVVIKPADVAPKPDSSFTNSEPTAIKQRDLKFRQGFRASWLFERRRVLLALALFLLITAVGLLTIGSQRPENLLRVQDSTRVSVFVLPFTGDDMPENERYLASGITENLNRFLSRIVAIDVRMPENDTVQAASAYQFRQVADLVNARIVLSGKINEINGEFTVMVRCYDRASDSIRWEKSFLRNRDEFQQIEEKIINELLASVGRDDRGAPWTAITRNPNAYHNFMKGRELRLRMGNENLRESLQYFRNAYAEDPDFALAYSSIGEAYSLLANNGGAEPNEALPLARAAINRALALNDTLVDAYIESAALKTYEWDWNSAEDEFQKAINLNPLSLKAHRRYALFLALQGRYDEAFPEMQRAQAIDPMSIYLKKQEGLILIYARRYDEAFKLFTDYNYLEFDKLNNYELGWIEMLRANYDRAVPHFEKVMEESSSDPSVKCFMAFALARLGKREQAKKIVANIDAPNSGVSPAIRAFAYIGLGDKETALDRLEEAYLKHDLQLIYLHSEGMYDEIRDHPRFISLIERVGLPRTAPNRP